MRTLEEVLAAHPLPFELEQMQKEDIVRMAGWRRVLADLPVGYGKTVISTCVALMLEPDVTVILVPPILIVQWVAWIESIPGAGRVVAYTGSPADRAQLNIKSARWVVMSYGLFRNDVDRLKRALTDHTVLTIVDECQNLKNARSLLFKHVKDFSTARDLLLMSGTIMSGPADAYSYIKLNTPGAYRTYAQFENIHVEERDFFEQPTKWHNLDILQTNLNQRRVYRSKEEVHSALPKANFIPIYYDLTKEHMALYERLMNEQLLALSDGSKIDATTAQALYHCAQQIISNFDYFSGDESKRSTVYDLLDNVVDEIGLGDAGSSKLIVWTQYKRTSRSALAYLNGKGGKAVGAYSEVDAKKSVASFLNDPKTVTLVAQPGSAGAGLNPQHLCWECIFLETPTRTIPFTQAGGRIDRKGQKYNPNIRLAIARGTIQERLLQNLLENDDVVRRASGSKQGIKSLIFPNQ